MDKNEGTGSSSQEGNLGSDRRPQGDTSNELDSPSEKRQKTSGFSSQQLESQTFHQGAGSGWSQTVHFQPQPQLQQQHPLLQVALPWGLQPQLQLQSPLQQPCTWGPQPQIQQQPLQQGTWPWGSQLQLQPQAQPQTQGAWICGHHSQVQQQQTQLQPHQQVIGSWGLQSQFQLQPPEQHCSWPWVAQSQLQQLPIQQLLPQFQQQQSQPQVHKQVTCPWGLQSESQQQPQSPFQQQQSYQQAVWFTQPQTEKQQHQIHSNTIPTQPSQPQFRVQIQQDQPLLEVKPEQRHQAQQLQPQIAQQQLQAQSQQQQQQQQIKSKQTRPQIPQQLLKQLKAEEQQSQFQQHQAQFQVQQPQLQPQIQKLQVPTQQPQPQFQAQQPQIEPQLQIKSSQQPQVQQLQPQIQQQQLQLQSQLSQTQFQQPQLQPPVQQEQPQLHIKSEQSQPQVQSQLQSHIQQQHPRLQRTWLCQPTSEVQLQQSQPLIQQPQTQQTQQRIKSAQRQSQIQQLQFQPQVPTQQPQPHFQFQQPQIQQQQPQLQGTWPWEPKSEVQPQQLQPPVQLQLPTTETACQDPQEQNLQQQPQDQPTQPQFASGESELRQHSLLHQEDSLPRDSRSHPRRVHKETVEKIQISQSTKRTSSASVEPPQFAHRIYATQKSGRTIEVATNFFPLIISNPNITVFHYDVIMEPDKPKHLFRKVWKEYVSLMFPGRLTAFDGRNAYSNGPLTRGEYATATVTAFNEENKKDEHFKVTIKEVRRVSFACFKNYRARMLQDRSLKVLPEAEMAVLDIILKNWACDNFVTCDRSFFPLSAMSPISKDLSKKLTLRNGYFQSAFLGYSPYLNFDISHRAFYKELSLLNVVVCFKNPHTKTLEVDQMNHFIRNIKVEYRLPNDTLSSRIYRVNKLVGDANTQTFTKQNGSKITVAQYFTQEKKCNIKYPQLPLLWVGPSQKTIYLPMEFCRIIPDQVYKGLMDPYETRQMVKNSTSNARDRHYAVNDMFKEININSHPLMKEFGLHVSEKMEVVPARILDAPELKTSRNIRVKEGVWRIKDFLDPVQLNKWCILVLDRRVSKESVMNLQRCLRDKGNEFNMRVSEAARNPIEVEPSAVALKKTFSQLKDMEMVFVIISEAKGLYSRVKTICETQEGVLTQCIRSKTVSQDPLKLRTTVENILLKVNAKLGGKNHCLDRNSSPQCLNGYVMVAGADVSHCGSGMNLPSVVAVTATCDPVSFQYSTVSRVQPRSVMIKDLEEIMSIHVEKFKELRGKYPEKIIFFRDGVSEGEMEKVLKGELSAIKRACNPYCQPKITFIVVHKRHRTRFYPTNPADEQGRNFNVPVGTCIDSKVVHPRELEFYLVSHASNLGTARPTRYRLLYDDNKLTDDELERLSYYLCHLYTKCNRSVSYPSPTYNAHLATARVRAYMEGLNLNNGNVSSENIGELQQKMPDRISNVSPMFFV